MRLLVVDASALLEFLLRTETAAVVTAPLTARDADLHVPSLCDVEVTAGLRRALAAGLLSQSRAESALRDYVDLPLVRHGHRLLLDRVLALRHNFSAYDAVYVALAERIAGALVTADRGLAAAVRAHTSVQLAAAGGI